MESGLPTERLHHSRKIPFSTLLMLAWRNLWRQKKRTLVTLSSIAFGFAMAVFFIGIGDGSHNSMIRNAIKMGEGHITIQASGYQEAPANHRYIENGVDLVTALESLNVKADSFPRVSLQVLASSANNSVGLVLEGVSKEGDPRFLDIEQKIVEGSMDILGSERSVLIGYKLAKKLRVETGSKIVLMAGKQGGDSQAQLVRVKGIFDSGLDELDSYLMFSSLNFAQLFLEGEGARLDQYPLTRIAVFLEDSDDQENELAILKEKLASDEIEILSWQQVMPQLVQFILIDDFGNYIFLLLILIMVAIGVVNTVLMSVLERTREFGLLRALGISRLYLMILVVMETLMLSFLSVTCGWVLATPIHLWFARHGIDFSALFGENTQMAGTYIDPVVYTELSMDRVIQLTSIIFLVTLATGIYPAMKAALVSPVEALKT